MVSERSAWLSVGSRRGQCRGWRARASAALAMASLVLVGGACKIERVQSLEFEAPVVLPSRWEMRPRIPVIHASEESLESLVRDELARFRGTELSAIEAVKARVEALGLSPAGRAGSWYFDVEVERLTTVEAALRPAPAAADVGEGGEVGAEDAGWIDAAWVRRRKPGAWSGVLPMVDVGLGLSDPASGWDDYAEGSVAGAVAVARWGVPDRSPSAQSWSDAERVQRKLRAALDAGAVGCIILAPESVMAGAEGLLPLAVDDARERGEPRGPQLEFEGLVSEAALSLPRPARGEAEAGKLELRVEARSDWTTHRALLARVVGAEQAERNVTIVVETPPAGQGWDIYQASSLVALARELVLYAERGVRLRRSVTLALLPAGGPTAELAAALVEFGPLPPQNMTAALILQDFVGAATQHRLRVMGLEDSALGERLGEVSRALGWSLEAFEDSGTLDPFSRVGVPVVGLTRGGDAVPADAAHWAESLVAETRMLLRVVLRLARDLDALRSKSPSATTSLEGGGAGLAAPSSPAAADQDAAKETQPDGSAAVTK